MRAEVKQLHQRLKTTLIYVTHDQIEAMTMADKIVVMNDGQVEQIGAPLDLYDRPLNRFVAGFIGSPAMNFLRGRVAGNGESAVFEAEGGIKLPIDAPSRTQAGHSVALGVRPEHLMLAADGIGAEVVVVEPTGSEVQINARADSGDEIIAVFRERHVFAPGDRISLKPQAGAIHLFDGETGARLS